MFLPGFKLSATRQCKPLTTRDRGYDAACNAMKISRKMTKDQNIQDGIVMSEYEITLSEKNFETEVLNSDKPFLVDLWAPWCGPCRLIGPVVEQIAFENHGKLKVGKLNVDDNQVLASRYGVQSIPTLMLFKDGKAVERIVGVVAKSKIQQMIDNYI